MRIILNPTLWQELHVEDEQEFVRAAFYLGYSVLYIKNTVGYVSRALERKSIIATAIQLGMTDEDVVIKSLPPKGQ